MCTGPEGNMTSRGQMGATGCSVALQALHTSQGPLRASAHRTLSTRAYTAVFLFYSEKSEKAAIID